MMYFSRIRFDPGRAGPESFLELSRMNLYREHKMIWRFFEEDPAAQRDFLFRRMDHNRLPQFYLLSRRKPLNPGGNWSVDVQEFNPKLRVGSVLSFSLRANPVVKKRTESGRQKRDDVVMEARHKYKDSPETAPPLNQIITEAGLGWLSDRSEKCGFQIEPGRVLVDGYSRLDDWKDRSGHHIQMGVIDYSGILEVSDVEVFSKTLLGGLGPAKAFGCGLLLVKPV